MKKWLIAFLALALVIPALAQEKPQKEEPAKAQAAPQAKPEAPPPTPPPRSLRSASRDASLPAEPSGSARGAVAQAMGRWRSSCAAHTTSHAAEKGRVAGWKYHWPIRSMRTMPSCFTPWPRVGSMRAG